MTKITVDARGLSCPQPVLLTKEALAQPADCYELLVDNHTALNNVTRFAKNAGKQVQATEQGEDFLLTIS